MKSNLFSELFSALGSAVTDIAESIVAAIAKTTFVDADLFVIADSEDSNKTKKVTWANVKLAIWAYIQSVFTTTLTVVSGTTNFPAATKNGIYQVSGNGWLGGIAGAGLEVSDGDWLICTTTNAGGAYAAVVDYWIHVPRVVYHADGYRYLELASDTVATKIPTNGFRWLNNTLIAYENSIAKYLNITTTIHASSGTIATIECYNGKISNYGQTLDTTLALPIAAKDMSLIVAFGTAVAKYYRIDPDITNSIYYEGVTTGAGKYVGVTATAIGQMMQLFTVQTGASTYAWVVNPNFSGLIQEA